MFVLKKRSGTQIVFDKNRYNFFLTHLLKKIDQKRILQISSVRLRIRQKVVRKVISKDLTNHQNC